MSSPFLAADQCHNGNATSALSSPQKHLSPKTPSVPNGALLREQGRDPQLEEPPSQPLTTRPVGMHPLFNSSQTSVGGGSGNNHEVASLSSSSSGSTATHHIASSNAVGNGSEPLPSDLVQHCLLFPTYATRHSRSASKDPHDWNVRVRGWAFSKRSNRRKRLVMSMARKIAGVTKDDNKLYETLESRFGMFLASNSKNARFSIQCVGIAETSHMELAGDPHGDNPTVNELLNEAQTEEGEKAYNETHQEKEKLRNALWTGQDISQIQVNDFEPAAQSATSTFEQTKDRLKQKWMNTTKASDTPTAPVATQTRNNEHRQSPPNAISSSPYRAMEMKTSVPSDYHQRHSEGTESESRLERLSRGAVMLKDTFKKYKTSILPERFNGSTDSLSLAQSGSRQGSSVSDYSGDEGISTSGVSTQVPSTVRRTESDDSVQSQSHTYPEDFGHGLMPTVQISTRIGGHFHGTLRVTVDEVAAMASSSNRQDGPRFLKLQAFHEDMQDECHGVVNLIEPEGISVISDIDDTIKETDVPAGARIILRNTFLCDMQEVEGMPQVYKNWWQHGAAIHYVSNSPWQLIPSLLEFFHSHEFPPGSAHLRLHDSVIKTYFMTPGEHKRRSIQEILEDFPDRKFILVGDSGEIDLEIYTEMAVRYPHQIRKIFIRDITTSRLQELHTKIPTARSSSFTSLIHKVPVNAVTSRLGFLYNRHNGSSTNVVTQGNGKKRTNSGSSQDSDVIGSSGHNSHDEHAASSSPNRVGGSDDDDEKNVLSEEPTALEEAQSNTASRERRQATRMGTLHHNLEDLELDPSEPASAMAGVRLSKKPDMPANEYPFPMIDDTSSNTLHLPSQFPISNGASPTWTPGQSPLHSPQWGVQGLTTNNNGHGVGNGGGSGTATPAVKNPLEVWLDRVEACRRQLPEGMLTFFDKSEALEQDPLVNQLFDDFERSRKKTQRAESSSNDSAKTGTTLKEEITKTALF